MKEITVSQHKEKVNDLDLYLERVVTFILLFFKINLSVSEKRLFGYYLYYGVSSETDELFINNKNIKEKAGLYNLRFKLKQNNIIDKANLLYPFNISLKDGIGFKILITRENE